MKKRASWECSYEWIERWVQIVVFWAEAWTSSEMKLGQLCGHSFLRISISVVFSLFSSISSSELSASFEERLTIVSSKKFLIPLLWLVGSTRHLCWIHNINELNTTIFDCITCDFLKMSMTSFHDSGWFLKSFNMVCHPWWISLDNRSFFYQFFQATKIL